MQLPTTSEQTNETPEPEQGTPSAGPNFDKPLKPITELVTLPGFPKCALGEHVNIGGYAGVILEIVNQSIKVRSTDGATKSFNVHALRRLYGPATPLEPPPDMSRFAQRPAPARERDAAVPPTPKREVITEPNFDQPIRTIREFISRPDYPKCTLGAHVEINGYAGVVVEIVNRSLKVRSPQEITRSYNADVLRKLHGTA